MKKAPKEILEHFRNINYARCLSNGQIYDISKAKEYYYDGVDCYVVVNKYYVILWRVESGFATRFTEVE